MSDEPDAEVDGKKNKHIEYPYAFANAADYNAVMTFCIERVPFEFDHHLEYKRTALTRTCVWYW